MRDCARSLSPSWRRAIRSGACRLSPTPSTIGPSSDSQSFLNGFSADDEKASRHNFVFAPLTHFADSVCSPGFSRSAVSAGVVLLACVGLSRAQVQYWKGDYELFERAREVLVSATTQQVEHTWVAEKRVLRGTDRRDRERGGLPQNDWLQELVR